MYKQQMVLSPKKKKKKKKKQSNHLKLLNNMVVYTLLNRKNKILILKLTKGNKLEIEKILFPM